MMSSARDTLGPKRAECQRIPLAFRHLLDLFAIRFQKRSVFVGRTRVKRREQEEEVPVPEEMETSPEEVELSDFLDGLGPQGISDVSLYRSSDSLRAVRQPNSQNNTFKCSLAKATISQEPN